jgi:hypothetical protein
MSSPTAAPRRRWRLPAILAATAALIAGAAAISLQQAGAATVNTSAWYVLVNRNSGKAMDVWERSTADGGQIRQYTRTDAVNQQFQFVDVGSGYYQLHNRNSGKVIAVPNANDGAQVIQTTASTDTKQQFTLKDSSGGYVRFLNRHSGKALDMWEWSTADGGIVSQYADVDGANQQWQLVQVGTGGGTTPTTGSSTSGCGSGSFNAEVTVSGSTWTARNGSTTVYTGTSMLSAMQGAVNSLSSGRSSKQRVVVRGSGSVSAASRLSLPSYTTLDVCGTINVTGSGSGDMAPIYSRGTHDVEIQHVNITGTPVYGIFLRSVNNVVLGTIDIRVSSGLGVRIDNYGDKTVMARNYQIGTVYASGTSSHGVETYGVDGITIGTVTARNTGESGLLLNQTINATVGTVDAENAGTGTGYAAFRMANRNGRIGSSYPTNIRVGLVKARGGGRGVFCVSESGGAVIDRVDIANTGNNSILIENCYGVTIANVSGTVTGSDVRISSRTEFPVSSNITLKNLTLTNSKILESPCATNTVISNITLVNSTITRC